MLSYGGYFNFQNLWKNLAGVLLVAPEVNVGEWHAKTTELPMHELEDVSFEYHFPQDLDDLERDVKPNLPWAQEHFTERVCGQPLNPPPSAERWPFAQHAHRDHLIDGKFSHTYPERFWPVNAGYPEGTPHQGIRFQYGDLNDLVTLLRERPYTRQAYLPVWFPEDLTAANERHRVPCSLGYHFMVRRECGVDRMTIRYFMRSCDFMRHFNDDVYLAILLGMWIGSRVNKETVVEKLVMHISSLHIFPNDRHTLRYKLRRG
jgi:hypothetical protein